MWCGIFASTFAVKYTNFAFRQTPHFLLYRRHLRLAAFDRVRLLYRLRQLNLAWQRRRRVCQVNKIKVCKIE